MFFVKINQGVECQNGLLFFFEVLYGVYIFIAVVVEKQKVFTLANLFAFVVCFSCRHDWYQTESQVIVTVMAKNVPKDGVCVNYMEREV